MDQFSATTKWSLRLALVVGIPIFFPVIVIVIVIVDFCFWLFPLILVSVAVIWRFCHNVTFRSFRHRKLQVFAQPPSTESFFFLQTQMTPVQNGHIRQHLEQMRLCATLCPRRTNKKTTTGEGNHPGSLLNGCFSVHIEQKIRTINGLYVQKGHSCEIVSVVGGKVCCLAPTGFISSAIIYTKKFLRTWSTVANEPIVSMPGSVT